MAKDVFTADIEHGGLTNEYEIRILVCWLLNRIKSPVTPAQLYSAMLGERLVNYFEATQAVRQLLQSGHLLALAPDDPEGPLTVTDLGRKTGETFQSDLPRSVRDRMIEALGRSVMQDRFARENRAEVTECEDGFRLELALRDVGNDLLSLSLYAPTREMAQRMRESFLKDPTLVYRTLLASLTGERLPGIDLLDDLEP